jgi:hypothetical protein
MKHAALLALVIALALCSRAFAQGTGAWHEAAAICPAKYQMLKGETLTCDAKQCSWWPDGKKHCEPDRCEAQCAGKLEWVFRNHQEQLRDAP